MHEEADDNELIIEDGLYIRTFNREWHLTGPQADLLIGFVLFLLALMAITCCAGVFL